MFFSNPHQRPIQWQFDLENAYRKPPVILKIVHWTKSTNRRDAKTKIYQWQGRKAGQKFCFFFRKFLESVSVFKEASKNFILFFLL
jgi:hypothetical protein